MRKQKRFRKKHNPKLVKTRLTYSVADICELYGVHSNTVLNWMKEGLKRMDDAYPYLVYGQDLADFISSRRKKKITLADDEFNCFKCCCPRKSWENIADVQIHSPYNANLKAICAVCETNINKRFSLAKLPEMQKIFKIQQVHGERLIQRGESSGNCESKEEKSDG